MIKGQKTETFQMTSRRTRILLFSTSLAHSKVNGKVEKDAKHIRELMGPRIEKGNGMLTPVAAAVERKKKKNNFGCTLT